MTHPALTVRQLKKLQILQYISEGLITKEIADKMNMSPRTVENYRFEMMQHHGAKTIAHLVVICVRKNIIQL